MFRSDSNGAQTRQFIETFNDRNLFDDDALKDPVEKARLVVDRVNPWKVRVSADVRARTLAHLVGVRTFADGLVTERKRRNSNVEL